jgi:alkanesulfonate monooxygenase SsuD/methylene tetrahydromethanopterin reductase-like flavin-dependent oxidoreductase (luciferase family)
MRIGLDLAQHHLSWDDLRGRAQFAEQAGFEGAWLIDHLKAMYGAAVRRIPCLR